MRGITILWDRSLKKGRPPLGGRGGLRRPSGRSAALAGEGALRTIAVEGRRYDEDNGSRPSAILHLSIAWPARVSATGLESSDAAAALYAVVLESIYVVRGNIHNGLVNLALRRLLDMRLQTPATS